MALPIETVRLIIKTAVEAQGMKFYFGTEADAFLEKLESGAELETDGFCLMKDTTDNIKNLNEDWQLIPIRLSLERQTAMGAVLLIEDEQGTLAARQDLRTAMYNEWIDILEYIRENNFDTDIQDDWTYKFISFGENVTEGVMVDFNMLINGYC